VFASKNSSLFSWSKKILSDYWSSCPSEKNIEEFVLLKIHPGLSFVTGIVLSFFVYSWKMFNCKYIQISLGFNETTQKMLAYTSTAGVFAEVAAATDLSTVAVKVIVFGREV
jgi:hypothetical protein